MSALVSAEALVDCSATTGVVIIDGEHGSSICISLVSCDEGTFASEMPTFDTHCLLLFRVSDPFTVWPRVLITGLSRLLKVVEPVSAIFTPCLLD